MSNVDDLLKNGRLKKGNYSPEMCEAVMKSLKEIEAVLLPDKGEETHA